MITKKVISAFIVIVASGLALLSACGGGDTTEATEIPTASATAVGFTPAPSPTSAPEEEGESGDSPVLVEASRTPEPTATPGPVTDAVDEIAQATGLDRVNFLGLSGDEWINAAISLLMVLLFFWVGTRLVMYILRQVVRRTPTVYDDQFLELIKGQVRALVLVISADWATSRLQFINEDLTRAVNDILFLLYLTIIFSILWKLVDFSIDEYVKAKTAGKDVDAEKQKTLSTLFLRGGQIVLLVTYGGMVLSHFGINITAAMTALGIGGLALSLAAQDTLSDMISGFIIMLDQPFRIGDRIEIAELNTWGDVVEIGTRTTKIRTRDNRLVIVPNSTISNNQVVNYTYPDPRYRVQIDIGIGYGMDIEETRQVIIDAVKNVPGILPDKPVDALYNEMGDSAMIFRVRWWIESYEDTRRIYDRVNTALNKALDDAGIVSPYPISDVNIKIDEVDAQHLAEALGE